MDARAAPGLTPLHLAAMHGRAAAAGALLAAGADLTARVGGGPATLRGEHAARWPPAPADAAPVWRLSAFAYWLNYQKGTCGFATVDVLVVHVQSQRTSVFPLQSMFQAAGALLSKVGAGLGACKADLQDVRVCF